MLGRNLWWLRRSLLGLRKHTSRRRQDQASLGFRAAAAVAQSAKQLRLLSRQSILNLGPSKRCNGANVRSIPGRGI